MFVGRERELSDLDVALLRAASSDGSLFLLAGEPGIGKTRLAAEVARVARGRGFRAAWGRCWEAGGAPALWPWHESLTALGLELPAAPTMAASDPAESRFAFFRTIASLLATEAARSPLLIVLEDLHAADLSTLLLLELLARQLRSLPIVVVGTYRDLEARLRPEVGDALARIGRSGTVLPLSRLRESEVTALVHSAIADADARLGASVFETTHGNPLFVDEIVRDIRTRGAGAGPSIPLGVREVIRQRLSLLSSDARRVLDAAAVLGVELGAAEVERMVPGAGAVLDDAARSGLVDVVGRRFRFSHALYREALYHDLPRGRRQELHRDAAHALAATGAPLAEQAHHLLEAGPDLAVDAIDHALRAAVQALGVFAFEDAAALLDRARSAIPSGSLEAMLRARVLIARGDARIQAGDPTGRELCVEAAQIARALGDPKLLGLAALGYGAVFTMGGVDPTLVGMLEEALVSFPSEDSALRARVMARLGAARQPSAMEARARDIELALDAIAMARRVAEPRDLLAVLHSASGALYGAADPRVRLRNSRDQEHLAEQLGDTTRLLQARVRIAMDLLETGDFASYAQLATAYEQVATPIGRAAGLWRVSLMRSMLALLADRFDESARHQEDAAHAESERPSARRAQTFHRIGFLRAAERHEELRAGIPALRSAWLEMPFGVVLAEARVASSHARIGEEREARAILDGLGDAAFGEQINSAALAEAVWLTGDTTLARRLLPSLAWLEGRWLTYWLDCEIVEAPGPRLLAYLSGIVGAWDEAEHQFDAALRAVDDAGRRALASRMRFEYGDLLARSGREPERAQALIAAARGGASEAGVPELLALIDRRHPTRGRSAPKNVAPAAAFAMAREGEYYTVRGGAGTPRFKATRGMHYLAHLVERPGVEVHVLELAGSSDHADRGDAGELLDQPAFRGYRARLEKLREAIEQAEALGNDERAHRAREEMEAIASELVKATRSGGRPRRAESAVDRARSAVQRRIKDAVDRIAAEDAALGTWLRRAVRTGNYCSYRPDA